MISKVSTYLALVYGRANFFLRKINPRAQYRESASTERARVPKIPSFDGYTAVEAKETKFSFTDTLYHAQRSPTVAFVRFNAPFDWAPCNLSYSSNGKSRYSLCASSRLRLRMMRADATCGPRPSSSDGLDRAATTGRHRRDRSNAPSVLPVDLEKAEYQV